MKCQIPTLKLLMPFFMLICMITGSSVLAQAPTVTTRFANQHYDCVNDVNCVDVEFQTDQDSVEIFGMNVRFFYDDEVLELVDFSDFQGGYDIVAPIPPLVSMSAP